MKRFDKSAQKAVGLRSIRRTFGIVGQQLGDSAEHRVNQVLQEATRKFPDASLAERLGKIRA